ncbi:MAG TPA: S9 family peptidase, partial [Candidatus Eremiobacteraceae bacterium]|nr:S9 family peptidase [Candidatus Eremiobacteraceae bacterium]
FLVIAGSMNRADARLMGLGDLRRIVDVSEPQLSPDGKSVAVVVSRINWDEDRRDSSLVLIDVASGAQRTLTHGRDDVSTPRWSPTGDRLAFIDSVSDGNDTSAQVFVLPMSGGDAVKITSAANDVEQYAWKPDGSQIAFVTQDENPKREGAARFLDGFEVGDNDYLRRGASLPSHLWLASASGGSTKRLTHGGWSISTPDGGAGTPISWSSDGNHIAITKLPNAIYGDSDPATIAIVDAHTGSVNDVPGQSPYLTGPEYSPAGDSLMSAWYRHGTFNSDASVVTTTAAGGKGTPATPGLDRNIDWYRWAGNGSALYEAGEDGARVSLWSAPVGGHAKKIDLGEVNFGNDGDTGKGGALAFVGVTPTDPGEIYYLASADAQARKLTNFNSAIEALQLGAMREITWTGPGGYAEDGILTTPPGFTPAKTYPLAVYVHGGPQGADSLSFESLGQLLAARGFVVFQPNYRGSTNLGDAYQHAIYRDGGDGPGKDVMAGVAAVRKLGFADASRMSVSGWSYGGYMTSWLSGHYPVWKAAVAGAALNDYPLDYTISWYQEGDASDFFGGGPNDPRTKAMWIEQSPLTYASRVTAPTLIMGDVGDANVPIVNSYEMYHALKDRGVTVQFIAYPVDVHFPDDPVRESDVDRRWIAWLEKYAK